MEIDFCSSADLDGISSVEERSFLSPWPREVIARDLGGDGSYLYLCARAGGRILGFGALLKKGTAAELVNLAVDPEFRRRGVASQLLAGFSEIAGNLGCRKMILFVRESNSGAAALYGLFGFALLGRDRKYYADGEDALVMEALLPLRLPHDGSALPPA